MVRPAAHQGDAVRAVFLSRGQHCIRHSAEREHR
jgi:hypothetical protein